MVLLDRLVQPVIPVQLVQQVQFLDQQVRQEQLEQPVILVQQDQLEVQDQPVQQDLLVLLVLLV